jgi:dethiobiotin synthase
MAETFVVVGIGTGVGKTLASALLCKAWGAAYWKPIQTGWLNGSGDSDTMEVNQLSNCSTYPEAYLLEEPLSPHAAAILDGVKVQTDQIRIPKHEGPLIIEGAGGLMVPLNEKDLYIDLLAHWKLPVILVVRHYLGNINHTLLSLEALGHRKIPVAGIIVQGNGLPYTMPAICQFGKVPILMEVPELASITPEHIAILAEKIPPINSLA